MGKISKEKEAYLIKFFDPNERLNKICPSCGSDKIVFLQYGMWDEEDKHLIDSGEVVLLGCVFGEHNLACRDCELTFASILNPEAVENTD